MAQAPPSLDGLSSYKIGSISPQDLAQAQNERLLRSLQPVPKIQFARQKSDDVTQSDIIANARSVAHSAGVNSIAVDRFEDSSLAIWDLESESVSDYEKTYLPLDSVARTSTTESLGVNHVSWYPFDSLSFLTSGFDQTVKLFDSETLVAAATFELGSTVYCHAMSPVATHVQVACATQHPAVRLIDLRSGASTHSLAGHTGSVLTVAWHPKNDNILASGATDGSCRLWDIRRSASSLGTLDMEDSIGIAGYDGRGTGARQRERGKAHNGPVNGIVWSANCQYLVSTGHDDRMRVWDMRTGANTLANFGPIIKNTHMGVVTPLIAPSYLSTAGTETIFFPNPREILDFDMHSGALRKRLRALGPQGSQISTVGPRNLQTRTTSLAWRTHHVELYSGHADGRIRCWQPRTVEDTIGQREMESSDDEEAHASERKRKREELEQIVRDLTTKRA
nr:dna excision repair protein ckn1 [Quercus suber]